MSRDNRGGNSVGVQGTRLGSLAGTEGGFQGKRENTPLFISLSPKLCFKCLEGETKSYSSLFS